MREWSISVPLTNEFGLDWETQKRTDPLDPKHWSVECMKILAIDSRFILLLASLLMNSVSDPYSFFTDPDPEVEAGDQYGSGSNTDPGF
jgi:hypothetical protein